jgi:hypothetical protein
VLTQTDWEVQLSDPDHPEYWLLRLGYADYLEENGREKEARAWRKIVEKRYKPDNTFDSSKWYWFSPSNRKKGGNCLAYDQSKGETRELAVLEDKLIDMTMGHTNRYGAGYSGAGFHSHNKAELELIAAMLRINNDT